MEKKKIYIFLTSVVYCIRLSWEASRLYTLIRLLTYATNAIFPLISIYASKRFIDTLVQAGQIKQPFQEALLWLFVICVLALIGTGTNRLLQYVQNIHGELMNNNIQIGMMQKSMTVDMDFFDSPGYIDAMRAAMIDSSALPNIVWNIFAGFSGLISFASAFILLSAENLLFPIILTFTAIPSAIANQRYTKLLYNWRLTHIAEDRKMSYIQSIASSKISAGDVRLFNIKDFLVTRYQNIWELIFFGRKKLLKRQLITALLTLFLPETTIFIFLIMLTRSIINAGNTIGDYSLYSGLLYSLSGSIIYVVNSIASIYEDKLKVETVKRFESRENSVPDNGSMELTGYPDIEFCDVCFKYPETDHFVIKNLSFRVLPKEKICLIGTNGAGKSTIIKLLLRFYDVTDGQILINGYDIKKYRLNSLRRCFSTFFQQFDKYAFSLRDNITISDLEQADADDKKIIDIIDKVNALDILQKMSCGLDTVLSRAFDTDGFEPSGGEIQKIALARAIYRSCRMVIFDEPSSSLDVKSEIALFDNMKELFQDKSALFTSHRLNIVHLSDRILMLDNGRITESGSHKELMKSGGEYAKLYSLQAERYKD